MKMSQRVLFIVSQIAMPNFFFFPKNLDNSTLSAHSSECLISEKTFSPTNSVLLPRSKSRKRPLESVNENDQHRHQRRRTQQSLHLSESGRSDRPPPLPLPVPQYFTPEARSTVVPMEEDIQPMLAAWLRFLEKGKKAAEHKSWGDKGVDKEISKMVANDEKKGKKGNQFLQVCLRPNFCDMNDRALCIYSRRIYARF